MKKFMIFLVLAIFLLPSAVFAKPTPVKIDGKSENAFILDQMLPNPSVYLYGLDSNGFPILLMNFSLTIPVFALDDNPLLRPFEFLGRFAPTFHKKTKSLKSITFYLKINESKESADGKHFYYKIVKLQCDQESQGIQYQDFSEWKLHGEGSYTYMDSASAKATVDRNMSRRMDYLSKLPIKDYSGVGSDTLKIILKRGRKYPIPAGHINISMVVAAIPYYRNPPLSYCSLKCNTCNYDFLKDFMTSTNPEAPCTPIIRKIYFSKTYTDNSMMNYYEITPDNNPEHLIIDSEVVMGNRINGCPILLFQRNTTIKTCQDLNRKPANPCKCCTSKPDDKPKPDEKPKAANPCGSEKTLVDNWSTVTRTNEDSYGLILNDDAFMYNNIFTKQLPNTESVSPAADASDTASFSSTSSSAAAAKK